MATAAGINDIKRQLNIEPCISMAMSTSLPGSEDLFDQINFLLPFSYQRQYDVPLSTKIWLPGNQTPRLHREGIAKAFIPPIEGVRNTAHQNRCKERGVPESMSWLNKPPWRTSPLRSKANVMWEL